MSADPVEFDPFTQTESVPHDLFARLRAECPVARVPLGWYLSKHADVVAASRETDVFVASFRAPGVVVPEEEKFISEISEPRHGRVRRVVNGALAPQRSSRVEQFVRDLCREQLGTIVARGHGDLVGEYAIPIPINVIAHLLGVPRADWAQFQEWSDDITHGTYPALHRNERGEGLAGAHPEFAAYLDALIAARSGADGAPDDVITRLLDADVEGQKLSAVEVRTQIAFLILAGNETTRQLLGNLLVRVVQDPALLDALRTDISFVEPMVEESLRIDAPFPMLLRNVEERTDQFGPEMCPGEKVIFGLASANRDEERFSSPDEFRVDRENARDHVAFGAGPHVCPGASLARLEGRVALETFVELVGAVELEPGWIPRKTPVFFANGPVDLPVRIASA